MKKEKIEQLLSREQFKELVFKRDRNTCVFCNQPAVDAHHILERKLFSDGGYYLNNGASVCSFHHLECEKTNITVEAVRSAAKIKNFVMPDGYCISKIYDKWGNQILPNGSRLAGKLFNDDGHLKIMKEKLYLF